MVQGHAHRHHNAGEVGHAEFSFDPDKREDRERHRVAQHHRAHIEFSERDRRGADADLHIVITVNHRVLGIVGDSPEDVGKQQPPCHRRQALEHRRETHRNAEAEGDAKISLRYCQKTFGERVTDGQQQGDHRQAPHHVVELDDQQKCTNGKYGCQQQCLLAAHPARGQGPLGRALDVTIKVDVDVVVDDASGRAHEQRAERENPDQPPSGSTASRDPERPQGRPQQQQRADRLV